MTLLRCWLLVALVACVSSEPDDEMVLATDDAATLATDKADSASWQAAATLHADTSVFDFASTGARRVHSLWVMGSTTTPVPFTVSARAGTGYDVRIAVLGPLVGGTRTVLAADGYAVQKSFASTTIDVTTAGEHLVVVGSYRLASDTFYELAATCSGAGCTPERIDVLSSPKHGALVGDPQRLVAMSLGDVMSGFNGDVEVELWASRPMQHWNATHVATSVASGTQVNAIAPAAVNAGDDLRLLVREPGGRVLDTGVTTRFAPQPTAFARLDAILYGDIASLQIAGVVGFFEGHADMRLYSETRAIMLAEHNLTADKPGMIGNGLNAFDATFLPDLSIAATDGELLSVGFINGNGDYRRLGCFEYCNNLSGMSSCTGGPQPCPTL